MISLATVKTFLGISDTTYDAAITAMIPIAEAKYREISGYDFNWMIYVQFESGENTFEVGCVDYAVKFGDAFLSGEPAKDSSLWQLRYGDIIEGTGIPAETYITAIDTFENTVTVSANFTADSDRMRVTTNISYRPIMSQLIWYMISQQSTTAIDTKDLKSKKVGPLSVTFADDEINSSFGVPMKIVNSILKYAGIY